MKHHVSCMISAGMLSSCLCGTAWLTCPIDPYEPLVLVVKDARAAQHGTRNNATPHAKQHLAAKLQAASGKMRGSQVIHRSAQQRR